MSEIGRRITEVRQALGLSRRDLADRMGVSYPTVAAYERGERGDKLDRVADFAEAMRVPVSMLLGIGSERDTSDPVTLALYAMIPEMDDHARKQLLGFAQMLTEARKGGNDGA